MIEIYACTLLTNIFLSILTTSYGENNTNDIIDKLCYFQETIGCNDKVPSPMSFYIVCPILNIITAMTLAFILFSKYESFIRVVEWMDD